ncbi:hypothetical protein GSI_05305 [Ganoderma sinense ZZ0214-1]|uniref:Uncharacterized protein n=1 Tax=Ganoderma sinense ZZ0214-1 TaxID=1077348 RepID=A0A2G8SFR5_9APHY|nr:hypothetical protein GSI_05305 [Ganoderma sinense ZZ0214-1]
MQACMQEDVDERMVEDLLGGPLSPESSFSAGNQSMDIDPIVMNSVEFKVSDLALDKEELGVVTMLLEDLDFKDMSDYKGKDKVVPPPREELFLPFPV